MADRLTNNNECCFDEENFIYKCREINQNKSLYCYIKTFGCQQNEADSEKLLGMAIAMGYSPTSTPDNADLILINTCSIRENAERKALSILGRFKELKKKNPEIVIGVMGCMGSRAEVVKHLKSQFKYVAFSLSPSLLSKMPEAVYSYISEKKRSFESDISIPSLSEGLDTVRKDKHKAYVSIMYGCNNFCSYCIVPYTRGRERSRCSKNIIAECRELVLAGVSEITLLGQNVNSYKSDLTFAELLSRIAEIEGRFIIKFMTSHPKDVSDELIEVIRNNREKIAPYFHLPLQSGSDKILKKMNRSYDTERYLSVVSKLRNAVPDIALSTDIIVGFPGESDEDFEDTISILENVKFDMVYAFMYSPREGTPAAKLDNQIPKTVKKERISRLLKLQDLISMEKNRAIVGSTQTVLVESIEESSEMRRINARTLTNKCVSFDSKSAELGEFLEVEITEAKPYGLSAKEIQ